MNTTKSIYNKLFKEETQLASHKVELALIDDLKQMVVRMKALDGAFMKSTQKAVNALSAFAKVQGDLKDGFDNASLDRDDAKDEIKVAVALIEKISKQAKELGLNPNDIPQTKEIVNLTANIEDTIAILDRNESDIKQILSI
jgi:hypothetical protein